jgi:hypothetical protein
MQTKTIRELLVAVAAGVLGFCACSNSADTGPQLGLGTQTAGKSATGGSHSSGGSTGSGATGSGATGGGPVVVVGPNSPDAGDASADTACVGLECQKTTCTLGACTVPACASGASTTLTGTVYEPAGKVPLYNVMVYVPNGSVPDIKTGATCDRCDTTVLNPVASALTDTHGQFTLDDVPVGSNIPLVIQVGKWRRQVSVNVNACAENPVSADLTHLPRNQSEGNIPLIAITTGGLDSMECLPRRMGIDDAEFTTDQGNGRIHLYAGPDVVGGGPGGGRMGGGLMGGMSFQATKAFDPSLNGGATFTAATTLWAGTPTLDVYDMVILSCEGETFENLKPPSARQAMYDYASAGGRVFASHWHHIWFSAGPPPVPSVDTWSDQMDPQSPATGTINTSFPKGQALADWLVNVGASTTSGTLDIVAARDNVQAVTSNEALGWITVQNQMDAQNPNAVEYLTFNTPLGIPEDQKCGRMVYTDLHVSSTGADKPGAPFPTGCEVRDLSPQEKAVMFILFDLSSCVMDDHNPPQPPSIR